jgi:hypothetical protein
MTTIRILPGPVMPGPRDDEVTTAAQNILIRAQRDDWPEKLFAPTRTADQESSAPLTCSQSVTRLAATGHFLMTAGGQVSMAANTGSISVTRSNQGLLVISRA